MTDETGLRASDADREHAALALRDAAADGRLTLDELTDRLDGAYGAKTRGELDRVLSDLGRAAPAQPPARAGRRRVLAIMSGTNLRGRFRVDGELRVLALMGGVNLDLRGAELTQPETTIRVVALMGGVNVYVPVGVEVDAHDVVAIMGGRNVRVPEPTAANPPRIRLQGLALMGGVNVVARPR